MTIDDADISLLSAIADGLPLIPQPFAEVAARLGTGEGDILQRLKRLVESGTVSRFGVVVRHREAGFTANAMCVWDVPDEEVTCIGERMARFPFVTLCYQRRRHHPDWPYNLFCMIHGQDHAEVRGQIACVIQELSIEHLPHAVLFSRRRFKQRGAVYRHARNAA